MRIIRASEVGEYLYCQRAWWYSSQGHQSDHQREIEGGQVFHQKHARLIIISGCLRTLAYVLLTIAVIFAFIYLLGVKL